MFKNTIKKAKDLVIQTDEGNNKKKIENLIVFLIILVITIVAINVIWSGDKKKTDTKQESTNDPNKQLASLNSIQTEGTVETSSNAEQNLETKLEEILSKIEGVGQVKVLLNYSETNEIVPMYNENTKQSSTEEQDKTGGTRNISQTDSEKEIIYKEENGEKIPITQKVIMPKMEGAIVTASGANDAIVKTNIIQAVEAVTGLASHKIQVFSMKTN